MTLKLRRTTDEETVHRLDKVCFPGETPTTADQWWLLTDEAGPCGYCGARKLTAEPGVFLCRAGVLPRARGLGAQRRMIRVRLRWAQSVGARYAVTYVHRENSSSLVDLLRCGFRLYEPAEYWSGAEMLYLHRSL